MGYYINQKNKFMNIEQIKEDLILLIAQLTDAEIPDLDNISEAIEQIFNQNN